MRDASLILMTLNELPALREILPQLPLLEFNECLAVDGGSTDGTRELLAQWHIPVIDQGKPGFGEAMRLGLERASGRNRVIFCPDGNHLASDVVKVLDALEKGADLVIASRFLRTSAHQQEGELLRLRARGARLLSHLARKRNPNATVTDATQSFRGITREGLSRLQLTASGFDISYQMTLQALNAGLTIGEVPTLEGRRLVGTARPPRLESFFRHLKVLAMEGRAKKG